jgi:hypothetical protein
MNEKVNLKSLSNFKINQNDNIESLDNETQTHYDRKGKLADNIDYNSLYSTDRPLNENEKNTNKENRNKETLSNKYKFTLDAEGIHTFSNNKAQINELINSNKKNITILIPERQDKIKFSNKLNKIDYRWFDPNFTISEKIEEFFKIQLKHYYFIVSTLILLLLFIIIEIKYRKSNFLIKDNKNESVNFNNLTTSFPKNNTLSFNFEKLNYIEKRNASCALLLIILIEKIVLQICYYKVSYSVNFNILIK